MLVLAASPWPCGRAHNYGWHNLNLALTFRSMTSMNGSHWLQLHFMMSDHKGFMVGRIVRVYEWQLLTLHFNINARWSVRRNVFKKKQVFVIHRPERYFIPSSSSQIWLAPSSSFPSTIIDMAIFIGCSGITIHNGNFTNNIQTEGTGLSIQVFLSKSCYWRYWIQPQQMGLWFSIYVRSSSSIYLIYSFIGSEGRRRRAA